MLFNFFFLFNLLFLMHAFIISFGLLTLFPFHCFLFKLTLKPISIYHLITEEAPIEASASVSMASAESTAPKERKTPTATPIPMKGFFDGADVFVGTTTFTTPLGRLLLKQQFLHQSLFLPRRVP